MENITLTPHQQEGLNKLLEAYQQRQRTKTWSALLEGYAGVGKTTLMRALISELLRLSPQLNIMVTAPTHKALNILREKIPNENGKIIFKTIHSALGLRLNDEEEMEEGERVTLKNAGFVIIDEASMLDRWLYAKIKKERYHAFVLFSGDRFQLSPVTKQQESYISPAFEDMEGKVHVVLSEPIRQARDNPIIELSIAIRQAEEQGKRFDLSVIKHYIDNTDEINVLGPEEAVAMSMAEPEKNRIVAWTNERVRYYNTSVHRGIYFASPYIFEVGERIVFTKPFRYYIPQIDGYRVISIGEEYEVEAVSDYNDRTLPLLTIELAGKKFLCPQDPYGFQKRFFDSWNSVKDEEAREFLRKLKQTVVFISHTYASTSHKSQGSTYDNVLIDIKDIKKMPQRADFNRALYVAVTRARYKVYFVR